MNHYKHLCLQERELLFAYREQGLSFRDIGKKLKRNHTTLSREYKKCAKYGKAYIPCKAQAKADKIALRQRQTCGLKNHIVFSYVRKKLRKHWSPETIAGRLPMTHPGEKIHHETIYRYIYNSKKTRGMKLWQYLTLHRKKRMKKHGRKVTNRSKIKNAVSIDSRPSYIQKRIQSGHWETDNMEGKQRDKQSVSFTVERHSRYVFVNKLHNRTAVEKKDKIVQRMKTLPKDLRRSITTDNGSENSAHEQITKEIEAPVYFCHPYHSWEKGTVENTIGRARRFIPKGTSIHTVSEKQLAKVEHWLNHTPRKCLGYLTPYEKMQKLLTKT